jgi:hypothetical protein
MAPDAPMSGAAEDGLAAANCTALPGVQRRPPRFAISDDAARVDGGEWCRAAVIEIQTCRDRAESRA